MHLYPIILTSFISTNRSEATTQSCYTTARSYTYFTYYKAQTIVESFIERLQLRAAQFDSSRT